MKKVAVCISGALRGGVSNFDNLRRNLVDPLDADVFVSTWDNHYAKNPIIDGGGFTVARYLGMEMHEAFPPEFRNFGSLKSHFPKTFEKLSQKQVLATRSDEIAGYFPTLKNISIISEKGFEKVYETVFSKYLEVFRDSRKKNQFKMFYMLHHCDRSLGEYEKLTRTKYDVVIRVRADFSVKAPFDVSITDSIEPNEILTRYIWFGLDDAMFATERSTMKRICSIWEKMLDTAWLSPFSGYDWASDHYLLLLWTIAENIRVKNANRIPCFVTDFDNFCKPFDRENNPYREMLEDIEDMPENAEKLARLKNYIFEKMKELQL